MAVWLQAELRLTGTNPLADLKSWLSTAGTRDMAQLSGGLWGCWIGGDLGFGLRSDTILVYTHWPDDAAAGAATELLRNAPPVVAVEATPLHATVRPGETSEVTGDGLWVFREFTLLQTDAERFVDLSVCAWETFEACFDARIHGLFRAPAPQPLLARLLLVTRYADLATWQASRSKDRDPKSWRYFAERHALIHWTRACCAARLAI